MNIKIERYGFRPWEFPENESGIPARVTAVHRGHYEIICALGTGLASLKAGEYYSGDEVVPATGDFVLLDWQADGESRILKTLPRRTCFSRRDPSAASGEEQVVAANFDYVFLLQSLDRDFNPRRLERYLTLAWQSGAVPVVMLTKADGLEEHSAHLRAAQQLAAGASVFAVSAKTGYGLEQLAEYLKPGKTVVFLGSSGVGKSTLINALAGEDVMVTGGVREKDGRGRHTTSHRQLLRLRCGALVIDTPGMRELGMWDVSEGLGQSFSDVETYLGRCKFSDCHHRKEPGCAVMAAIRQGELTLERWESYHKLHEEARFADDKAGYLREKQQRFKEIAKFQRSKKEVDYRHAPCGESFVCAVCGGSAAPEGAGSQHRNHCPHCLSSLHVDNRLGDRASLCRGVMEPVSVWVRKGGEWAIIHRCRTCGTLGSNRVAADDNEELLRAIASKPMAQPPVPQWRQESTAE